MKYRKKSVIIDAFQMTRTAAADNTDWPDWLVEAWRKHESELGSLSRLPNFNRSAHLMKIKTLESNDHLVSDGDFIIRGVRGEVYSCKPDAFKQTYEPAPIE